MTIGFGMQDPVLNEPRHSWYQKRNHVRIPKIAECKKYLDHYWVGGVVPVLPANTSPPIITATSALPGATYSINTNGVWSGTPTPSITRLWYVNGVATVQTGVTFTPSPSLIAGNTVKLRETATNAAGVVSVFSNELTVGAALPPAITTPPVITSNHFLPGAMYSRVSAGIWTGSPSVTQAWCVNGTPTANTGNTWTPSPVLVNGDIVTLRETATNAGGSATSNSNAEYVWDGILFDEISGSPLSDQLSGAMLSDEIAAA